MSSISYSLLSHELELSYTGDNVRAGAFYGNTDGVHTVSWTCNNFTGRFVIEGTLSAEPTESDWFMIELDPITQYKEYTAYSGTEGLSFKMNLMFIRARVDRDYLAAGEYNHSMHGAVSKALVNV